MSKPKIQDLTLSITGEELVRYFKSILEPVGQDKTVFSCSFCKSDEWFIKPFPGEDEKPMLVSQPIPHAKNLAAWFFPIGCRSCGYTMLFDAQVVTRAIEKNRKSEESDD